MGVNDEKSIPEVLLMSVFKQRFSFLFFYFIKSDQEIIVKCWRGPGGAATSIAGFWWRVQVGKPQANLAFLYLEGK